MNRAIGKSATMFHGPERILRIVIEVCSVAVIWRRFRCWRPLTNMKFTRLVLKLFIRDRIQACGTGRCNRKDELGLRSSLIRRANGRPGE